MHRLDLFYRNRGTVRKKVKIQRLPFERTVEIVARTLDKDPHGKL